MPASPPLVFFWCSSLRPALPSAIFFYTPPRPPASQPLSLVYLVLIPLMVVGFQAQQVHCITDKKGDVVEGADDKVTNNFYILCMQRDWDDDAGELQWKIIEFSLMMQMDYV